MPDGAVKPPVETPELSKIFPGLSAQAEPAESELRELARWEEELTEFGAPAYVTKLASSRSAGATFLLEEKTPLGRFQKRAEPALARDAIALARAAMPEEDWLRLDRVIGHNPEWTFHCRLWIPRSLARVALMWSRTLFPSSEAQREPRRAPDFLTVYYPRWKELRDKAGRADLPERMILVAPDSGVTYVLGVDYVGEAKMSFLRLAMFEAKKRGGLGLHAGSKILRVLDGKKTRDAGFLLFGLSGTGKTTLTLEDHGLKPPEAAVALQDDIVLLDPRGRAFGTEDNFYVKTEGLSQREQPTLHYALATPGSVFENVAVDLKTGKVDFKDYRRGTNGRALALRRRIPHTTESVDLERVDALVFITRRDTIVPALARLSSAQAAAFFMLGESIETSAGDPKKAGQPKHEVGFSPFIVGLEDGEGNRLRDILKANRGVEAYLLNTGSVGKGGDAPGAKPGGVKIPKDASAKLLEFLARPARKDPKAWKKDPDWGYEVPVDVPGLPDFASLDPARYYKPETYKRLTAELRRERLEFLGRFGELAPAAAKSLQ